MRGPTCSHTPGMQSYKTADRTSQQHHETLLRETAGGRQAKHVKVQTFSFSSLVQKCQVGYERSISKCLVLLKQVWSDFHHSVKYLTAPDDFAETVSVTTAHLQSAFIYVLHVAPTYLDLWL